MLATPGGEATRPTGRSFALQHVALPCEAPIRGHSGCHVAIEETDDGVVVVKSAVDPAYNERLRRQVAKQMNARALNTLRFVRIPCILSEGVVDGCYRATMEYVYFDNAIRYFSSASQRGVRAVTDMLIAYVDDHVRSSPVALQSVLPLQQKVQDVATELSGGEFYGLYRPHLRALEDDLERRPVIELPVGAGHGDLTFSNIMIASDCEALALIDFLDSYLESPVIDLAKLRQDTRFYWTVLMTDTAVDRVRYVQVMRCIDCAIESTYGDVSWYTDNIDLILRINMLRIAPYARSDGMHGFIADSLATIERS